MTDPKKPEQNSTDDAWADAMAEQGAGAADDDPWAAAFAEQAEAEVAVADSKATAAGDQVFKPLDASVNSSSMRDLEMIMDIPVKLTVELGRTRITIKQLLELAQGSVIELDGLAGEPMDILINGYLIAQGEVVVVDDKYGIRITEIITPSERVQKLNR
ncbi:MAG: flagellar motor switch protein FliN [Halomonas sp.]|nr:flagellar motor switch protein FliN [Halomonas sp.]